ncbi:proline dehydrogenase family protein [Demequina globuliformis]|uniref:proline dehydrogenase family protein n=1 Tax=Demequina globuliformis TaxID=676202 RepID=UPI0009FE467F|nr:bifunctional proline dehydrogenase/L-glutamate gamma-semialdehyde dehydrogenase [Demequina globuliformis]
MSIDAPSPTSVSRPSGPPSEPDQAVAQARAWNDAAASKAGTLGSTLMNQMLMRPGGLAFLTALMDGMFRPEDSKVAAQGLKDAAQKFPDGAPWPLRWAVAAGSVAASVAPSLAAHLGRRIVRTLVGHLVVDARPRRLSRSLRKLRATGAQVNLNLLGEAVLGRAEAARRVARTMDLIAHPDVDYVSIKVSAAVGPHSPWAVEEAIPDVVEALRPLYRAAREHGGVFINLDMEEYRDLEMTMEVFTRIMDDAEFSDLSAGIVLQAYLPESLAALRRLQEFAAARVSAGHAPLKVRLVKGANLSMEHVQAQLRGWQAAPWASKMETDAHYKRLIDLALDPSAVDSLHVGIAGHNLFDIALALHRARERGITRGVDVEMLLGMAPAHMAAIARDAGAVRLYTPAVDPRDFDVALAYLARRLEEVASAGNFVADAAQFSTSAEAFERQELAFREAWALSQAAPQRTRGRMPRRPGTPPAGFDNCVDTDPAVPEDRHSLRQAVVAAATSDLGIRDVQSHTIKEVEELSATVGRAHAAGIQWGAVPANERAVVLERVAEHLEDARARLIEVMAAECGKTIDQADPEVSEAIDFARYYAQSARQLTEIEGATPRPRRVTLVTPPWNFPVAIPAGSMLAALAAGSAVIVKPAPESSRCGAVVAEVLHAAGVPRDVLQCIHVDTDQLGKPLISDERIDQVILTGAYETAQTLLKTRPTLDLRAETSGKNVMIVTPHADVDLAVADLVASAFGHAGQKCSAASLVIAVGSVASSRRFKDQVVDAVTSLTVAPPHDPRSQMGPVIAPPQGKLRRALTELDEGETWWVAPHALDDALWSPGVKEGVKRGSWFHRTECFGPVLGVMTARTLDEAIDMVNELDYGLTAGLHSLDEGEIRTWLGRVEAGNAYVNRTTTGAIVQRQPFGGWKRSVVGPTVKAGGPHYVASLMGWENSPPAEVSAGGGASTALAPLVQEVVDASHHEWVRAAAHRDQGAWESTFGAGSDPTGLSAEYNVARYVPVRTPIRWDGDSPDALLRVVAASIRASGAATVSVPRGLGEPARALVGSHSDVIEEDIQHVATRAGAVGRVRVVGEEGPHLRGAADLAVWDRPVTGASSLELLAFLKEQSVSMCAHRYGTPFDTAHAVRDALMTGAISGSGPRG